MRKISVSRLSLPQASRQKSLTTSHFYTQLDPFAFEADDYLAEIDVYSIMGEIVNYQIVYLMTTGTRYMSS